MKENMNCYPADETPTILPELLHADFCSSRSKVEIRSSIACSFSSSAIQESLNRGWRKAASLNSSSENMSPNLLFTLDRSPLIRGLQCLIRWFVWSRSNCFLSTTMVGRRNPIETFLSACNISNARVRGSKILTYSLIKSSSDELRYGTPKCSKISWNSSVLKNHEVLDTFQSIIKWVPTGVVGNNIQSTQFVTNKVWRLGTSALMIPNTSELKKWTTICQ